GVRRTRRVRRGGPTHRRVRRVALKLLSAGLAAALAFTLNGVLLPVFDHLPESSVPSGVYFGWIDASGAAGRFQVSGDACIDASGDGHRLIEAVLSNRSGTAVLEPPAVDLVREAFSFDLAVPVYSFHSSAVAALVPLTSGDPSVRHTVPLDQLVVRCRDHSETSS